ncbi:hypothetical protein [Ammoniphilus sp. 3BR4]|uniref:hypothetical protein n=1 Tax=Ammoniphilus sp. 3BR4 TaxID=3158265 RepID=UPI00346732A6
MYYLEARTDPNTGKRMYNRHIKTNSSIIDSRREGYPVLVFLRYKKGDPFRFEGEFQYERTIVESTGDEYFELRRNPQEEIRIP